MYSSSKTWGRVLLLHLLNDNLLAGTTSARKSRSNKPEKSSGAGARGDIKLCHDVCHGAAPRVPTLRAPPRHQPRRATSWRSSRRRARPQIRACADSDPAGPLPWRQRALGCGLVFRCDLHLALNWSLVVHAPLRGGAATTQRRQGPPPFQPFALPGTGLRKAIAGGD